MIALNVLLKIALYTSLFSTNDAKYLIIFGWSKDWSSSISLIQSCLALASTISNIYNNDWYVNEDIYNEWLIYQWRYLELTEWDHPLDSTTAFFDRGDHNN